MNALTLALTHVDLGPLFYGLVIALGLTQLWWKLINGRITAFMTELTVFVLVFKLHGGSMTGGFAATIAALVCGWILPNLHAKRKR
jgi:hypothetical protein